MSALQSSAQQTCPAAASFLSFTGLEICSNQPSSSSHPAAAAGWCQRLAGQVSFPLAVWLAQLACVFPAVLLAVRGRGGGAGWGGSRSSSQQEAPPISPGFGLILRRTVKRYLLLHPCWRMGLPFDPGLC